MTNTTDSLWKFTGGELISLLKKKEISPIEVLKANVSRIEEVNSTVNAVVTMCIERAKNKINEDVKKINSVLGLLPVLIMGA